MNNKTFTQVELKEFQIAEVSLMSKAGGRMRPGPGKMYLLTRASE